MDKQLNQDVLAAIKKNLSSEVGSVLTEQLTRLATLEVEYKASDKSLNNAIEKCEALHKTIEEQKGELQTHAVLSTREREISRREDTLISSQMLFENRMLTERMAKQDEHTALLLRNTELRKQVWNENREPMIGSTSHVDGTITSDYAGENVTAVPGTESEQEV